MVTGYLKKQTNWYVITGGPGSGKSTIIELLREKKYVTTIERARHYIDTQRMAGKTVEEILKNQLEFQYGILDLQIEQETTLSPAETVFLDRAIPDTLAYIRFLKLPLNEKLRNALNYAAYKKIFILDCLPLVKDYARQEDEIAQKKIHELLSEVYESLAYPVIHVPVLEPNERVEFILTNL